MNYSTLHCAGLRKMSGRTHDVTISGFDLDRLEAELAKAASPDILHDFSALQSDVARLSQTNVELANRLMTVKQERDEARDVARWLYQHGMATLLEGAHRNEWIKEERK